MLKAKPELSYEFEHIIIEVKNQKNRVVIINGESYKRYSSDGNELIQSAYFTNKKEKAECLKKLEKAIDEIIKPYTQKWFAKRKRQLARKKFFSIKKSRK